MRDGPLRVAVVGGGVTGLAAAYALERRAEATNRAVDVTLLERDDRLGGKVQTERVGSLLIEQGPDALFLRSPFALDLLREIGQQDQVVRADTRHGSATILWRGRLYPLPAGMEGGVPRAVWPLATSNLLSPLGKLRAALEVAVPRGRSTADESVDAFVRRRFGGEVAERVAAPLLGNIYNNDTRRLSLLATAAHLRETERHSRSLLLAALTGRAGQPRPRGGVSPFAALRGGLATLPSALAARLRATRVLLSAPVRALDARGDGFVVECEDGRRIEVDRLILATPTWATAELLAPLAPGAAGPLAGIRYASTAIVALAFDAEGGRTLPPGGGFLTAPGEPGLMAACSWTSRKWPHCAPEDQLLLRVHLHAEGHPGLLETDDRALVNSVRQELGDLVGLRGSPRVSRVYRWPRSIPSYDLGHLDRVRAANEALRALPGLVLAGAGYRGAGIPECLRQGVDAATRALGDPNEVRKPTPHVTGPERRDTTAGPAPVRRR